MHEATEISFRKLLKVSAMEDVREVFMSKQCSGRAEMFGNKGFEWARITTYFYFYISVSLMAVVTKRTLAQ